VAYRLPAVYKADALVLVDPQKIPERFVASTVNLDAQDRLATISQEIMSATQLQNIINEFGLYAKERKLYTQEEIIEMMRKQIEVNLEKGVGGNRPGAFRVSFEGPNPQVVAAVVNRITSLYIDENARSREVRAVGTSTFIDNELRAAKENLEKQEAALSRYKIEHSGELPEQENSLVALTTQLQIELQGNQDAVNRVQQERTYLQDSLRAAESTEAALRPRPPVPSKALAPENTAGEIVPPAQSVYRKEYDDLQTELLSLRLKYSEKHPDIIRVRARLAAVERLLREDEERLRQQTLQAQRNNVEKPTPTPVPTVASDDPLAAQRVQIAERIKSVKAQLASTERELQTRMAERDKIVKDLASYQKRIESLPIREQEMASLTRDYEFSRTYYSSLFAKKTDAAMATDLEKRQKAETFQILDPAKPPSRPSKPKRRVLAAISGVLGLALGLATALAVEFKRGVLLGEWELPSGVTILGRVPRIVPAVAFHSSDTETRGTRERAAVKPNLATLYSTAGLLLGLMAAAIYLFVTHRL